MRLENDTLRSGWPWLTRREITPSRAAHTHHTFSLTAPPSPEVIVPSLNKIDPKMKKLAQIHQKTARKMMHMDLYHMTF